MTAQITVRLDGMLAEDAPPVRDPVGAYVEIS
jgi:hypothetical protein